MNILILGSGGREHAIAWKMAQSPLCDQLFIAPGNAGTALCGTNIDLAVHDFAAQKSFCLKHQIEMVIVGPEDPLVLGIYDYFQQAELSHIHLIGPSKAGAQLEGSKAFAKKFMQKMRIPTASYRAFSADDFTAGIRYLQQHALPVVLKADGLAAGKGVVIATTHDEAVQTFTAMIKDGKFGEAGAKVVIEEFLSGIECSVFVLTDGEHYCMLPSAKDYKRIGEGDTGLNTGGMGAVSPVPFMDDAFNEKVRTRIIEPTIAGLQEAEIVYKGFIFIGLINVNDEPYVIEYNCRMGDPETEAVMPRIENDLIPLFLSLKSNTLNEHTCVHHTQYAATIMLVSKGYPEAYEKGKAINGLSDVSDSLVFHAGTKVQHDEIVSNGGRVIAVTSLAESLSSALANSRLNAEKINFDGKYYRKDIGWEFESAD